jgi:plastocyanin
MRKFDIGVGAAVIVLGSLIILATTDHPASPQPSSSPTISPVANPTGSPQANASVLIVFTGNGFSPAQTTINAGQSLRFTNRSSVQVQVDSDPYPTQTDDPELNVGLIEAGQSKTVTVTNKGSFGFHNHLNPSMKARITIE